MPSSQAKQSLAATLKPRDGQPDATERTKLRAYLQALGVPVGKLNQLVAAGFSRREIAVRLINHCKVLPKKAG